MTRNNNSVSSCPDLMTLAEAAKALRVSESNIRRLIRSGELPAFQVGRKGAALRVRSNDVMAVLIPVPTQ